jgi:hypothetical protein
VDSALCCGQSFETFWKRVVIREAGHCLPHVVVKKERSYGTPSPIRLHGVHRDSFNTIQIGIVTDQMPCELNEIHCEAVGFGPRLFCLSFDTRICTKYRRENLIWSVLVVL